MEKCRFPLKKVKCDIAIPKAWGQGQRGVMQSVWGKGVVRFRYRGRRSEIGGRRTRNDGRRRAGEAEREVEGCSLGMINTTRTPSSHESSEDGSRSARN